ncbi:SKP1-interacting partner 15-like [Silene latifolia]|uniref:SKP1-interacting partner 15-like n=1 Tax=Silene latifolia TaxID=37657 RepID=UPI003D78ADA6
MDNPPIYRLPPDTLHLIFLSIPLRQIIICRSVSKPFHQLLTSPSFLSLLSSHSSLPLLAFRPPHHRHLRHRYSLSSHGPTISSLLAFDPSADRWLRFDLSFLPFSSMSPVTSTLGLLYLWANSPNLPETSKSLVVCNPLTRSYRILPQLGSAWSKHGSVLSGSGNRIAVLTELATLYFNGSGSGLKNWMKFSSNLPSKPRSPVIVANSLYALCDVGSPWRSVWKLFTCNLPILEVNTASLGWSKLEKDEWGDVFDILKRPRLVKGVENKVLMVGGLKSSFSLNAACSTILILRLDLETLEWYEAGRMPVDMYKCFQESSKFKVFGSGDKVCFSAKRVGKLALWDCGEWRWIDGAPGFGDGLYRGFMFDARLDVMP